MNKIFALTLTLTLALVLTAAASPAQAEPLDVAVSIAPEAFLAQAVGGPLVRVQTVVPPGSSPHSYEPTAQEMADLGRAKLYFAIGMPFEEVLVRKISAGNPGLKVIDARAGTRQRPLDAEDDDHDAAESHHEADEHHHHAGELDPHVWMSPRQAAIIAANMARALERADPAHAADYRRNLAALQKRLAELDARIGQVLAPLRGREVLVFHPAFGYLLDDYGLKQVAVESEGKQPGPRRLAMLIHQARHDGVRVVFVQPEFPQKSAEAIAQAIGGAVVPLDPLSPDYINNLEAMAGRIAQALK